MKRIYKYVLDRKHAHSRVDMPEGAHILTVQEQYGAITLWAVVDPDAPTVRRRFVIVGTGEAMPDGTAWYIATVQLDGGSLVCHVFEEGAQ